MVVPCGTSSRIFSMESSRSIRVFMTCSRDRAWSGSGTLPGIACLPDLPARQHAQAKAVRAGARTVVVEARSALPCRAW